MVSLSPILLPKLARGLSPTARRTLAAATATDAAVDVRRPAEPPDEIRSCRLTMIDRTVESELLGSLKAGLSDLVSLLEELILPRCEYPDPAYCLS